MAACPCIDEKQGQWLKPKSALSILNEGDNRRQHISFGLGTMLSAVYGRGLAEPNQNAGGHRLMFRQS